MKCPRCGGEIPFFDLRPNCKHCGVNIMYYTQEEELSRDAKRTELEGGAARMIIARVKAEFIGSKLAIVRLVITLLAVAALLVPFGGIHYSAPFFETSFSAGIIGVIQAFQNGLFMKLPQFLSSTLFARQTLAVAVYTGAMAVIALIDVINFVAFVLGFINLTKSAKFMRNCSIVGAVFSLVGQIVCVVFNVVIKDGEHASLTLGFGSLVCCAVFIVVAIINHMMLKKGIEPEYRENDIKRRELLKKVRSGEVDIDSLPLPIFESEEERNERIKALEEALKAEEEGKEL